jgi:hypothetical protein
MAEWFKAAVLKIASRATGTGVRIPLPPFFLQKKTNSEVECALKVGKETKA